MPPKKRQQYREGSVYQRHATKYGCPPAVDGIRPPHKCRGIWAATVEAGWNANGKRRRLPIYGKDEETVRRKLRDKQRALSLAADTGVSPRATIKSWAEEWLPMQERRLRPNAYNATRSAVQRWIIPTIGHKRFDALVPADVRAVVNAQRQVGLSSSTQLRTHSALMSLLKGASLEGYPVTERLLKVEAPIAAVSDRSDMTVEEAGAMLAAAAECIPHASRTVAAFLQGIRQAEALGLTWPEIDFKVGTLGVTWQLQRLPYRIAYDRDSGFRVPDGYESRQLSGGLHLVRPKSKHGHRVTPLTPWMRNALEAWRDVAPDSPHGLVWPNLDGEPTPSKIDDEEWYGLQQAADVRHPTGRLYTIHEARHTTATILLELGVDPEVIIKILGQSTILSKRPYSHVRNPMVLDALERVAGRLALG